MRKSIIAGLTLCAALAVAGQALAFEKGRTTPLHHKRHQSSSRVVETQPPTYLRIPANPVIRDCVHVTFPQCSLRSGLNDGQFGLPY
jgi:hypothetical protein